MHGARGIMVHTQAGRRDNTFQQLTTHPRHEPNTKLINTDVRRIKPYCEGCITRHGTVPQYRGTGTEWININFSEERRFEAFQLSTS